jgi:hypothetical protein
MMASKMLIIAHGCGIIFTDNVWKNRLLQLNYLKIGERENMDNNNQYQNQNQNQGQGQFQGQDHSSIIAKQQSTNRQYGILSIVLGLLALAGSIILLLVVHRIYVWFFILGGILLLAGIVYLVMKPSEADVDLKREDAAEFRKKGDFEQAERLEREAAALHEALKAKGNTPPPEPPRPEPPRQAPMPPQGQGAVYAQQAPMPPQGQGAVYAQQAPMPPQGQGAAYGQGSTLYLILKGQKFPLLSGNTIYQSYFDETCYDKTKQAGQVRSKPGEPQDIGIKNVSDFVWYVKRPYEEMKSIMPGTTVKVVKGTLITIGNFNIEVA